MNREKHVDIDRRGVEQRPDHALGQIAACKGEQRLKTQAFLPQESTTTPAIQLRERHGDGIAMEILKGAARSHERSHHHHTRRKKTRIKKIDIVTDRENLLRRAGGHEGAPADNGEEVEILQLEGQEVVGDDSERGPRIGAAADEVEDGAHEVREDEQEVDGEKAATDARSDEGRTASKARRAGGAEASMAAAAAASAARAAVAIGGEAIAAAIVAEVWAAAAGVAAAAAAAVEAA